MSEVGDNMDEFIEILTLICIYLKLSKQKNVSF